MSAGASLWFLSRNVECGRRTFAEQIDELTSVYARRTPLLAKTLERIGLALAGRWCRNRVEVLGINEFVLRKRHRYSAVLVDMSTHRPIDVLPERTGLGMTRTCPVAHDQGPAAIAHVGICPTANEMGGQSRS